MVKKLIFLVRFFIRFYQKYKFKLISFLYIFCILYFVFFIIYHIFKTNIPTLIKKRAINKKVHVVQILKIESYRKVLFKSRIIKNPIGRWFFITSSFLALFYFNLIINIFSIFIKIIILIINTILKLIQDIQRFLIINKYILLIFLDIILFIIFLKPIITDTFIYNIILYSILFLIINFKKITPIGSKKSFYLYYITTPLLIISKFFRNYKIYPILKQINIFKNILTKILIFLIKTLAFIMFILYNFELYIIKVYN